MNTILRLLCINREEFLNMYELSSKERIGRTLAGQLADRIPIIDQAWDATILRWQSEGMPVGVDVNKFLGIDSVVQYFPDYTPRLKTKVVEENEEFIIETTAWGVTLKNWKKKASVPAFLGAEITTYQKWLCIKDRLKADKSRIDWRFIKENYARWQKEGCWIEFFFWFGFDACHSWIVGTEQFLMAMALEPEWVHDMFSTLVNLNIEMAELFLEEGYDFDAIIWCDDMGYKQNQFFSLATYREILKPYQKKAADWAKNKGKKVRLHSCGDIKPFLPEIIEIGVDSIHPIEVKAGMDPQTIKKQFGNQITLHGGIDSLLFDNFQALKNNVEYLLPILKEGGRYMFSSDHSIPSSISLAEYRDIIDIVKKVGKY